MRACVRGELEGGWCIIGIERFEGKFGQLKGTPVGGWVISSRELVGYIRIASSSLWIWN